MYDVIGKYVSIGKCECGSYILTRFIVELNPKVISIELLRKLERNLIGLSIELESIVARLDNGRVHLDLCFIQIV